MYASRQPSGLAIETPGVVVIHSNARGPEVVAAVVPSGHTHVVLIRNLQPHETFATKPELLQTARDMVERAMGPQARKLKGIDKWTWNFRTQLAGLGVSFIDYRPREIAYLNLEGIGLAFRDGPRAQGLWFRLMHWQFDDCASVTTHPVVIGPVLEKGLVKQVAKGKLRCKDPVLDIAMERLKSVEGIHLR